MDGDQITTLDCSRYKMDKVRKNKMYIYIHGLFQVFMAHRREKNGHIAPLQKCLIKDILSLFDKEQVQVLGNTIERELFS